MPFPEIECYKVLLPFKHKGDVHKGTSGKIKVPMELDPYNIVGTYCAGRLPETQASPERKESLKKGVALEVPQDEHYEDDCANNAAR